MTTKILPIPEYVWERVPAKTKTGRVSKTRYDYVHRVVATEQECVEITARYFSREVVFYITMKDFKRYHDTKNGSQCAADVEVAIYNEKGERIMGNWQHGYSGTKIHVEAVRWDLKHQDFIWRTWYQDGRVKDSYKYLRSINF
jgi:hypothetical protein